MLTNKLLGGRFFQDRALAGRSGAMPSPGELLRTREREDRRHRKLIERESDRLTRSTSRDRKSPRALFGMAVVMLVAVAGYWVGVDTQAFLA